MPRDPAVRCQCVSHRHCYRLWCWGVYLTKVTAALTGSPGWAGRRCPVRWKSWQVEGLLLEGGRGTVCGSVAFDRVSLCSLISLSPCIKANKHRQPNRLHTRLRRSPPPLTGSHSQPSESTLPFSLTCLLFLKHTACSLALVMDPELNTHYDKFHALVPRNLLPHRHTPLRGTQRPSNPIGPTHNLLPHRHSPLP